MDILSARFSAVLPFGGPQGPVRVRIRDGVLILSRSDTSSDYLDSPSAGGLILFSTSRAKAEPVQVGIGEQSM